MRTPRATDQLDSLDRRMAQRVAGDMPPIWCSRIIAPGSFLTRGVAVQAAYACNPRHSATTIEPHPDPFDRTLPGA